MACTENWPTAENYKGSNLEPILTAPNDCYYLGNVAYGASALPDGITTADLCNYDSSDLIVVINIEKTAGCTPGEPDFNIDCPTNLVLDEEGNKAQIVIHNNDAGDTVTIKRTTRDVKNQG